MNKPFLLIAGDDYYPGGGTSDWIGCFATKEEIYVKELDNTYTFGPPITGYEIGGNEYDWYEIVDLRDWTNK